MLNLNITNTGGSKNTRKTRSTLSKKGLFSYLKKTDAKTLNSNIKSDMTKMKADVKKSGGFGAFVKKSMKTKADSLKTKMKSEFTKRKTAALKTLKKGATQLLNAAKNELIKALKEIIKIPEPILLGQLVALAKTTEGLDKAKTATTQLLPAAISKAGGGSPISKIGGTVVSNLATSAMGLPLNSDKPMKADPRYKNYYVLRMMVDRDFSLILRWMSHEYKLNLFSGSDSKVLNVAPAKGSTLTTFWLLEEWKKILPEDKYRKKAYSYIKRLLVNGRKNFNILSMQLFMKHERIKPSAFGDKGCEEYKTMFKFTNADINKMLPVSGGTLANKTYPKSKDIVVILNAMMMGDYSSYSNPKVVSPDGVAATQPMLPPQDDTSASAVIGMDINKLINLGDGRKIAVGRNGNINITDPENGYKWGYSRNISDNRNINDIIYRKISDGEEVFIAIADNSGIIRSELYGNWDDIVFINDPANLTSIIYNDDKYIISTNKDYFFYSSDGITWTKLLYKNINTSKKLGDYDKRKIIFTNNKYFTFDSSTISVANTLVFDSNTPSWETINLSGVYDIRNIKYHNGYYYIMTNKGILRVDEEYKIEKSKIKTPSSIVVFEGYTYVVDSEEHCLKIYDDKQRLFKVVGNQGDLDTEFNNPSSIILHVSELIVSDTDNNRLKRYTLSGELIDVIPNINITKPTDMSIYDNTLYIISQTDMSLTRIPLSNPSNFQKIIVNPELLSTLDNISINENIIYLSNAEHGTVVTYDTAPAIPKLIGSYSDANIVATGIQYIPSLRSLAVLDSVANRIIFLDDKLKKIIREIRLPLELNSELVTSFTILDHKPNKAIYIGYSDGGIALLTGYGEKFIKSYGNILTGGEINVLEDNAVTDIYFNQDIIACFGENGMGSHLINNEWKWSQPKNLLKSKHILGVTSNDNNFMIYGQDGYVATYDSFDSWVLPEVVLECSISLTKSLMGLIQKDLKNIYSMVNHRGVTMVVGQNALVQRTNDFKIWTLPERILGINDIRSVCTDDDYCLLVGGSGYINYSSDLLKWRKSQKISTDTLNYCTRFDNKYVVVGNSGFMKYALTLDPVVPGNNPSLWYSVSGNVLDKHNISKIKYINGEYIVFGANGYVNKTTNVLTWTSTPKSILAGNTIYDMIYHKGFYIAVGAKGMMSYSKDFITWSSPKNILSGRNINVILENPNAVDKLIIFGDGGLMTTQITIDNWSEPSDIFANKPIYGCYTSYDSSIFKERIYIYGGGGMFKDVTDKMDNTVEAVELLDVNQVVRKELKEAKAKIEERSRTFKDSTIRKIGEEVSQVQYDALNRLENDELVKRLWQNVIVFDEVSNVAAKIGEQLLKDTGIAGLVGQVKDIRSVMYKHVKKLIDEDLI